MAGVLKEASKKAEPSRYNHHRLPRRRPAKAAAKRGFAPAKPSGELADPDGSGTTKPAPAGGADYWMSQRVITLFENRSNYEFGPIGTANFFSADFLAKENRDFLEKIRIFWPRAESSFCLRKSKIRILAPIFLTNAVAM